jgi:alpha-tubulin suppressor-like RCC1 family protein
MVIIKILIFNFYFKKKIEKKKENIFGFGNNENGELGFSDVEKSSNLIQISFFNDKKIKDFCCGNGSNYVLIG